MKKNKMKELSVEEAAFSMGLTVSKYKEALIGFIIINGIKFQNGRPVSDESDEIKE